jgi:nickel/cobalt transporter (NicO) family protein
MKTLFLLALLVLPFKVLAHPHVLIDAGVEFTFNNEKQVTHLTHSWAFDEFYSAFVVADMKKNKSDTIPSLEKLHEFALSSVANLGDMGFFTSLKIGKIIPALERQGEPKMTYEKEKLILTFTLALKSPLALKGESLNLQVADPEFVVAFTPAPGESVTFKNAPQGCKIDYETPKSSISDARKLGESFFTQGLGQASFKNFTGSIRVDCP